MTALLIFVAIIVASVGAFLILAHRHRASRSAEDRLRDDAQVERLPGDW